MCNKVNSWLWISILLKKYDFILLFTLDNQFTNLFLLTANNYIIYVDLKMSNTIAE